MKNYKKAISALCIASAAAGLVFAACKKDGGNTNGGDSAEQHIALINGFDCWDDLKELEIDSALFYGSLSVNREAEYKVQGEGSAKYYVKGVGANNPSFKMLATRKSDITDVTQFGLYVYNANDYEFSVIISALDGSDGVIYTEFSEAKTGANELIFAVNRNMVKNTGASVAKYEISFNGVQGDSTLYLDNFYAKTDESEVKEDEDVRAVTEAIAKLNSSDRAACEAAMKDYRALNASKRKAVYNYQILKAAMNTFWLKDLSAAKAEDSDTLLFFDRSFAEVQIGKVSGSIGICDYTPDFAYGGQSGSLNVSFTASSENWVSVITVATVPVDATHISLHVYNESSQEKVFCVGWNGPTGADGSFWHLAPNAWTEIVCPSEYLTAHGGGFQMAGYDNGRGLAPEGNVYFSAVKTIDKNKQFNDLRTGEDKNTLLFFDRVEGLGQLGAYEPAEISIENSSEEKRVGENGSLKITFPGTEAHNWIRYDLCGYEYGAEDYAVFYIYNETNTDFISLLFGYENGTILRKGEWTAIVRKVSELDGSYFRFYGQDFVEVNGNGEASNKGANLAGSVYITKAKVYSSEAVKNLSAIGEAEEWSAGGVNFVGAPKAYEYTANNSLANKLINAEAEHNAFLLNGELRFAVWSHAYAGVYLRLKNSVSLAESDVYFAVTAKGAAQDKFLIHAMGANGEYDTLYGALSPINKIVGAEGYVTYLFRLPKKADKTLNGLRITPAGDTTGTCGSREIRIFEFAIGTAEEMQKKGYFEGTAASLRKGDDINTLFFFDRAEGVRQLGERGPAGISAEHSVEMKKTGENGATKLTFPGTEAHNWINYDLCGYEYAEDDYAVFYIYNNANTDFISLLFGYSNGVILRKGEWTMVARKVSELNGNYFRFYGQNFVATNGNSEASNTGAELAGSVYITKTKVYSSAAVKKLTAIESSEEWSIGNTTFKGAISVYGNVTGGLATGLINNAMERDAYLVNGELRSALWAHSYAGFYATLAQSVDLSENDMQISITMKGAAQDKFTIHAMGAGGEYDTLYNALNPEKIVANSDGFVTYTFTLAKLNGKTLNGLRITPAGDTTGSCGSREIRISDISVREAKAE